MLILLGALRETVGGSFHRLMRRVVLLAVCGVLTVWAVPGAYAGPVHAGGSGEGLGQMDRVTESQSAFAEIIQVLSLRDYNTRLVVLSTTALGVAAGLIGTFLLLRKRSLMGDALSHATLPGIVLAFMLMVSMGGSGKSLPGLLGGAAVFGLLGFGCVLLIKGTTRLKDDAAMGIVLSVFFGLGVALLGMVQDMPQGSAAGLESFIYGKTASMVYSDFVLIVGVALVVALACAALFKEFALLCFDEGFAGAQGWPVMRLDILLLVLVTAVTVIGLQAVGLILIIALLIIPPAAARFWTYDLRRLLMVGVLIGAISGWLGASISALVPRLPAGAVIVIVSAAVFVVSMFFGTARGVWVRALAHYRLTRKVGRQHLLRGMYEQLESEAGRVAAGLTREGATGRAVAFDELLTMRSWTPRRLRGLLSAAGRGGLVQWDLTNRYRLTESGLLEAARVARNHRLWEMYLITHADIAPSHVDRDADRIEHVLAPAMIAKLEKLLETKTPGLAVPPSPHAL